MGKYLNGFTITMEISPTMLCFVYLLQRHHAMTYTLYLNLNTSVPKKSPALYGSNGGWRHRNKTQFLWLKTISRDTLMYCFQGSWLSYDHHFWANFRGCASQFSLTIYVAAVAFMVIANIKPVGYQSTTSTTKSQKSYCPHPVTAGRHRSPPAGSATHPIKTRLTAGDRRSHPRGDLWLTKF